MLPVSDGGAPWAQSNGIAVDPYRQLVAIRSRNIDIPGEMSFVGFGDPEWYSWWGPGLTTVQLPVQSLATSCGLWFLDTLREGSEQALQADHQSTSTAQLVVRGSTGRR